MRDILFISHATPDDNEFAVWIATKLELLGYKDWIDVNSLNPASDFWDKIETTIREDAAKFIFIATKESILGNRDGVKKELAVADRVRRIIPEFIIPIKADDVDYNDYPTEILRLNAIDFVGNWARGLARLVEYLCEQKVPRSNLSVDPNGLVERWLSLKATISNKIIEKNDYYSSNIYPVRLPNYMYVYYADNVVRIFNEKHFEHKKIKNLLYTFTCPLCVEYLCDNNIEHDRYDVEELVMKSPEYIDTFGVRVKAPANICTELLNRSINQLFYQKRMEKFHEGEGKTSKTVYFFGYGTKSKRHEKSRKIQLAGKRLNNNWHYGLNAYFTTYPEPSYLFRWHLIFTDSNGKILPTATQISARRSKGRTLYNRQWRDLLNAAIYYLSEGKEQIIIDPCCCPSNIIEISSKSTNYVANIGYREPEAERVEDNNE